MFLQLDEQAHLTFLNHWNILLFEGKVYGIGRKATASLVVPIADIYPSSGKKTALNTIARSIIQLNLNIIALIYIFLGTICYG